MTGPNEPQDSPGQRPPESTDPWAPNPTSGGGEQPGSPWAPPAGQQQWGQGSGTGWGQSPTGQSPWQPDTGAGGNAPQPGWAPPVGQQTPGQPGPGHQNPWGAPTGAPQQGWGPAPQHPAPGWGQQAPGQQVPGQAPGWGQQPGAQPWGAPGQQPAQPGPGWGGQQPAGTQPWGAPANTWQQPGTPQQNGPHAGKSKLPWILGGVGLVVVLAIVGILTATMFGGKVLDTESTQAGIAKVLTESYGAGQVGDVQCPSDQKVEAGHSFTCAVTVDGQFREVTVTVTDDNGTYEVGRPN
ncbi:protein of unknown function [Rhodococcus rhodochrous J3]|uniref:DUF4333 domain-containing protein n=1 Tax=Rhodococcus rhodochrous J3 TaxID=903528 RepID=A0ABY1MI16_RHORH|nr:DUF4333 domain-containing protein [Rhodococcus rhodochrous]MBF4479508.1 DUF4333 domain-containing protein [Rhodococcus rhodochrous]SMG57195.1 protein of unknown function [Rhodococcus rhodochrous J3]